MGIQHVPSSETRLQIEVLKPALAQIAYYMGQLHYPITVIQLFGFGGPLDMKKVENLHEEYNCH